MNKKSFIANLRNLEHLCGECALVPKEKQKLVYLSVGKSSYLACGTCLTTCSVSGEKTRRERQL